MFAHAHALSPTKVPPGGAGVLEIHLSDPVIETAPVLRLFLTFATTLDQPINTPESNGNLLLVPLLQFLDKWECTALRRLLLGGLFAAVKTFSISPLKAYYIGAMIDEPDLCAAAIEGVEENSAEDEWWTTPWESNVVYPWAVWGWSTRFWRETANMPHQYRAAMVQAAVQAAENGHRITSVKPAEVFRMTKPAEVFRMTLKAALESDK